MQEVLVTDLGRIAFKEAWEIQQSLLDKLVHQKREQRGLSKSAQTSPKHYFLFCEHDPVFTLGKSGKEDHLLQLKSDTGKVKPDFYKINRGGDITYHGPGQLVGYPIFDLDWFFTDIHKYVRLLEEGVIRTLSDFGLKGRRVTDFTGVWLEGDEDEPARKICAIGVHLSRWVTMHGFALNVNTDLSYFNQIIPCGISDDDKTVTSFRQELGDEVALSEVRDRLLDHYADLFGFTYMQSNHLDLS